MPLRILNRLSAVNPPEGDIECSVPQACLTIQSFLLSGIFKRLVLRNIFWEIPDTEGSAWTRMVREVFLEEEAPRLHSRMGGLGDSAGSREGIPNESQEKALNMI